MQAPTFSQILRRSRADVDATRLASLHYWGSQNLSLKRLARSPKKHIFYVHPDMRSHLLRLRCRDNEMSYSSFGVDPHPIPPSTKSEKKFDVVWIGRVHRQKGIDDLLATLAHLARIIPNFKAVIIGKVKSELEPAVASMGLTPFVDFPGFVSEEKKFEIFASSRVFLMPSRFEGSPRVIGEALVCGLPVVAYRVPTYSAVFGDFIKTVACFDVDAFQRCTADQVTAMRRNENYLNGMNLDGFRKTHSWETTQATFIQAVRELSTDPCGA